MADNTEIHILNDVPELFQAAAAEFVTLASQFVATTGRFTVVLSGGSTPKGMYALLASGKFPEIPWDKIYFFWGDERHVPPDHPESNYRMAKEVLLSKVPVPEGNIFRIASEKDAETAAREYENTLQSFFQLKPGEFPRFDLLLLGMGPDGHAASLFPASKALQERTRLVVSNWVEKFKTDRITFTYPVLNNARNILFMAAGAEKALALQEVLTLKAAGPPAGRIHPENGKLVWLVDRAAASLLKPGS
jgi:6-phosphogluconolactonase